MLIFSKMKWTMGGVFCGALALTAANPAMADRITATCGTIAGVDTAEASYLYYEAEAEFGSGAAGRLYGAYHQLRSKCQHNPNARVVINVQPAVRAFFEARR